MSEVRVIDIAPAPIRRARKMKVLCLGLSRTGTVSLKAALTKLGYHPYHYYETLEKENIRRRHFACWREALQVHLTGKGIPYGRPEFDKLLGDYDAVTDTPCANFAKELIEAYPDAKVILNTRDVDKWMNSVERSLWAILETPTWGILRFLSFGRLGIPTQVLRMIMEDWTDGDWHNREKVRQFYYDHYDRVRAMVPKENLVEHTPKEGWEPICKLLGQPIPKEPYPHENEGDITWKRHFVGNMIMFGIFWGKIIATGGATYYAAKYLGILKNFNLE